MNSGGFNHKDCFNYAPVDVAKGICHRTKDPVMADMECCEQFEKAPRCKFCTHFSAGEEKYLGTCGAAPGRPMTYPDLAAVTCESFSWRDAAGAG